MNISFHIECQDIDQFIKHWSSKYFDSNEQKYDSNINRPLTEISRLELFEWKNGMKLSEKKRKSVLDNYPLRFEDDEEERYLNHQRDGGPIYNIFYLHCLNPSRWPIYDQHAYRAMRYIKTGEVVEIPKSPKIVYESYQNKYIPFIKEVFWEQYECNYRNVDKALFEYGKFLKTAGKYC